MTAPDRGEPTAVTAVEAGAMLDLPPDVVRALADAGYLRTIELRTGTPRFALGDLKALGARLVDTSSAEGPRWEEADDFGSELDADALLAALDGRSAAMAERTLELFTAVFPDAARYTDSQRDRFLHEARERIEAILAVCVHGPSTVSPVEEDLAELGADAAHAQVPLPHLLFSLRASRDLVVATAIEVAEEKGGRWGLALAVTLTRVLPSIDRLADALARGYWEAVVEIEAETADRFVNMAEAASDGVFDIDATGVVRHANPVLARLVGASADELVGRPVHDVLGIGAGEAAEVVVDGRRVRVSQFERLRDGVTVGWDGIVVAVGEAR